MESTWIDVYTTFNYRNVELAVTSDWNDTSDIINAIERQKNSYGGYATMAIQNKDVHISITKNTEEQSLDIPLLETSMYKMFPTFSYLCVFYKSYDTVLELINTKEKMLITVILCLQKKAKKYIPKPLIKRIIKLAFYSNGGYSSIRFNMV